MIYIDYIVLRITYIKQFNEVNMNNKFEYGNVVIGPNESPEEIQRKLDEQRKLLLASSKIHVNTTIRGDVVERTTSINGTETKSTSRNTGNISTELFNISFERQPHQPTTSELKLDIISWDRRLKYPVPNISSDGDIDLRSLISVKNASKLWVKGGNSLTLYVDNGDNKTMSLDNAKFTGLKEGVEFKVNGISINPDSNGEIDLKELPDKFEYRFLTSYVLKEFTNDEVKKVSLKQETAIDKETTTDQNNVSISKPEVLGFYTSKEVEKVNLKEQALTLN